MTSEKIQYQREMNKQVRETRALEKQTTKRFKAEEKAHTAEERKLKYKDKQKKAFSKKFNEVLGKKTKSVGVRIGVGTGYKKNVTVKLKPYQPYEGNAFLGTKY